MELLRLMIIILQDNLRTDCVSLKISSPNFKQRVKNYLREIARVNFLPSVSYFVGFNWIWQGKNG
jgi:hypothetical protein